MPRASRLQRVAIALVALALCAWWINAITVRPIESDGAQNLVMAVNLAHEGTISMSGAAPYEPSRYREPVPIAVWSIGVHLADVLAGPADSPADYAQGARARIVKSVNVAWMLLFCAGVLVATAHLTGSWWPGLVVAIAVNFRLPATQTGLPVLGLDDLLSDLPAAGLMLWGAYLLMRSIQTSSYLRFLAAGVLFGALALTKAAFLYIFAGVLVVGFVLTALGGPAARRLPNAALAMIVMALGFATMTGPWMARNQVKLGSPSIADRGGVILLMRANKDLMTAEEYRGAFYIWAPATLRPLVGRVLGFDESDLQRAGRLARLSRHEGTDFFDSEERAEREGRPQDAVTYYYKARAERERLIHASDGSSAARAAADEELQRQALQIVRENPGRHLWAVLPFLWRGAFTVFPMLLVSALAALAMRRWDVLGLLTPAIGAVAFYALLSHYVDRYSVPMVGIALVSFVWVAWELITAQRGRYRAKTSVR